MTAIEDQVSISLLRDLLFVREIGDANKSFEMKKKLKFEKG